MVPPRFQYRDMWGVSVDFVIQWVSPGLAHFVGCEVDDMLGLDFRLFVCPQDLRMVETTVRTKSTNTFRQWVRTPTGPQEVDITPVWAEYRGKKARFTCMVPVTAEVEK